MINYMHRLFNMSVIYYLLAGVIAAGLFLWRKKWNISLLAGYCFLILAGAVLSRRPTAEPQYTLQVLWSWKVWGRQHLQILANVVAFIPTGFLAASLLKWRAIMPAIGFSVFVEITQLVTCRGLFEFDDMIHNSIGAVTGAVIYMGILWLAEKWKRSTKDRRTQTAEKKGIPRWQ